MVFPTESMLVGQWTITTPVADPHADGIDHRGTTLCLADS